MLEVLREPTVRELLDMVLRRVRHYEIECV